MGFMDKLSMKSKSGGTKQNFILTS